jgi:hypothetical protein
MFCSVIIYNANLNISCFTHLWHMADENWDAAYGEDRPNQKIKAKYTPYKKGGKYRATKVK